MLNRVERFGDRIAALFGLTACIGYTGAFLSELSASLAKSAQVETKDIRIAVRS